MMNPFETGENFDSVTKDVSGIVIGNLSLVDTPGINDPLREEGIRDEDIAKDVAKKINRDFSSSAAGITGIIQAITVDTVGGRIRDSGIKAMADTIQSLTTMYKD